MKSILTTVAVAALALSSAVSVQAAPTQGGKLTVPLITPGFVQDFSPFAKGQSQIDIVRGTMFEPLWAFNVLKGEINWRLAESFEYADDLMHIDITLKPNLTWSDGQVIDADDLVFSAMLGKDHYFDEYGLWKDGTMKNAVKLSKLKVRLNFNKPSATADWYLPTLRLIPEHIWSKVDPKTFTNPDGIGSGPITEVKHFSPEQIDICRNPHYYKANQGLPYLDCIVFKQFSENNQIQNALMNDEIDWGSNFIADIDKTYVATSPETHGYWYPANDLINFYLNTRKKPFNDVRFRQALSMALDRSTIVDLAAYGYPTSESRVTGIGEYFKAHFRDDVNPDYNYLAQYNPIRAKELLAEAGYRDIDGDGYLENPDGSRISIKIDVVSGWTDWEQTVQMATEYMRDIGIRATKNPVDWNGYDSALKQGTYDISINWSRTGVDPIMAYQGYYHMSNVGNDWQANTGFASNKMTALIDEYLAINDQKRRDQILEIMMRYTAENLPFIPVFSNPTWYQYNSTRVVGWPNADNPYVHPNFYDEQRKLILFEQLYQR